eukprot:TRINITY_DN991_c0_g1_i2.p1 TRINITY_DN991_c0_g1~~TRINITY_DN991_c0_g1_i2.p1  ORF type:complete len:723 (+),score=119.62 TRINITY_DN991_c0_g1_i2:1263-3431(+)
MNPYVAKSSYPKGPIVPKRSWESWNDAENEAFFEGLRLYGKNFEKITNTVRSKNKEQVRHYFYRSAKKIHSMLSAASYQLNMKNQTDAVRALLGYWKLKALPIFKINPSGRGRWTIMQEKLFVNSLQELIINGSTKIKVRKNSRISTIRIENPLLVPDSTNVSGKMNSGNSKSVHELGPSSSKSDMFVKSSSNYKEPWKRSDGITDLRVGTISDSCVNANFADKKGGANTSNPSSALSKSHSDATMTGNEAVSKDEILADNGNSRNSGLSLISYAAQTLERVLPTHKKDMEGPSVTKMLSQMHGGLIEAGDTEILLQIVRNLDAPCAHFKPEAAENLRHMQWLTQKLSSQHYKMVLRMLDIDSRNRAHDEEAQAPQQECERNDSRIPESKAVPSLDVPLSTQQESIGPAAGKENANQTQWHFEQARQEEIIDPQYEKLTLNLVPHDNTTETLMHNAGYHPKLQLSFKSTKSIGSIISHLGKKWKKVNHPDLDPTLPFHLIYEPSNVTYEENSAESCYSVFRDLGMPDPFILEYAWRLSSKDKDQHLTAGYESAHVIMHDDFHQGAVPLSHQGVWLRHTDIIPPEPMRIAPVISNAHQCASIPHPTLPDTALSFIGIATHTRPSARPEGLFEDSMDGFGAHQWEANEQLVKKSWGLYDPKHSTTAYPHTEAPPMSHDDAAKSSDRATNSFDWRRGIIALAPADNSIGLGIGGNSNSHFGDLWH